MIGTDAFQEADTVGITMPVTKHNWLITDAQDIPRVVREAFHVATTGRPGPVLVDFPKDVANATMEWYWPEKVDLPGYKPNVKGHPKQIKDAARLDHRKRASRSSTRAAASSRRARRAQLRELAELTGIPVVTTLMGRGALPDEHPLCLGMPGMHGNYTAVTAMQKSDLLDHARRALRRPRHRQRRRRSRRTPRSSTSTSIPPSSARCGTPTCRSSATCGP